MRLAKPLEFDGIKFPLGNVDAETPGMCPIIAPLTSEPEPLSPIRNAPGLDCADWTYIFDLLTMQLHTPSH